jgi:outer membrane protein
MKRIKYITYIMIFVCSFWPAILYAANLIDAYCQALKCDPTFKAAQANLLANKENIPINRAALLPNVNFKANTYREWGYIQSAISILSSTIIPSSAHSHMGTFYDTHADYALTITQPLFNYTNWARLKQAKASVKQAEASFCASAQDLMIRVSQAYFDVLKANADLFYTQEQEKAVARQLSENQERFKAGVLPITGVYEAQANYDIIAAQEVNDRYYLATKVEALRQITNRLYASLQGLNNYLPLVAPNPKDINAWVCTAEQQNYELLSARYAALAALQNIKVQFGGHLPVINATGQYSDTYDSNFYGLGRLHVKLAEAGLSFNMPIYQGGLINAETKQANYQYQTTIQQQEYTHRKVVAQTRTTFLGVFSGIALVYADKQAVRSNQVSLNATIDGYKAGTRTILDVLNQQAQLYNSLKNYVKDQYGYVFETLLLKQAAGTLCVMDLQRVNSWLRSCVDLGSYNALLEGCIVPWH